MRARGYKGKGINEGREGSWVVGLALWEVRI